MTKNKVRIYRYVERLQASVKEDGIIDTDELLDRVDLAEIQPILKELEGVREILEDDCGYTDSCGCASCRALTDLNNLIKELEGE